jgi:hypothetical protein
MDDIELTLHHVDPVVAVGRAPAEFAPVVEQRLDHPYRIVVGRHAHR